MTRSRKLPVLAAVTLLLAVTAVGSISVGSAAAPTASPASPASSVESPKVAGRFIAVAPPDAGDKTYANFLWVIDSVTGEVVAYRIARVANEAGEVEAFVTEKLQSDTEYIVNKALKTLNDLQEQSDK